MRHIFGIRGESKILARDFYMGTEIVQNRLVPSTTEVIFLNEEFSLRICYVFLLPVSRETFVIIQKVVITCQDIVNIRDCQCSNGKVRCRAEPHIAPPPHVIAL